MNDDHHMFFRIGYVTVAALAGAVTALAFTRWREMSWSEVGLPLVVGFSFALFVTPWVASEVLGIQDSNLRALAALTYIFGAGSNILLPMAIRWAGNAFGNGGPGK